MSKTVKMGAGLQGGERVSQQIFFTITLISGGLLPREVH